jgi:hypothetical protein
LGEKTALDVQREFVLPLLDRRDLKQGVARAQIQHHPGRRGGWNFTVGHAHTDLHARSPGIGQVVGVGLVVWIQFQQPAFSQIERHIGPVIILDRCLCDE